MSDASAPRAPEEGGDGPFHGLRNWLRQLTRSRNGESLRHSLEELIEEHAEEAPIDAHERELLANILTLHELTATDIMVPRVDIVAVEVDTPFAEVVKLMAERGHSRLPVYRETLDDVIGIIHIKDLLPYALAGRAVPIVKLVRKVLFAAPSMPILDLLLQMRLSRLHLALVVDEFGGIDGLVTIEDVIEEIVGEIEDEHDDPDAPQLVERPDGTLVVDARLPIETLQERTSARLLPAEVEEEVDTLGGLVSMLAGRVPGRGEIIAHPAGIEFEVLEADPRRIKRLKISHLPPAPPPGDV